MTRQGFYAWKRRPPSKRELADRVLAERIREILSSHSWPPSAWAVQLAWFSALITNRPNSVEIG